VETRLGDKEGKKTRRKNRTEFGSVKHTIKSRNVLFFVKTLPCLRSLSEVEVMVYLSSLSYLNPNLKKPTLVREQEGSKRVRFPFSPGWEKGLGDEGEMLRSR